MAEISILKIKRGRCKGSLTTIASYLSKITNQTTSIDIEARLNRLKEVWLEIVSVEDQIFMLAPELPSEYSEAEERYIELNGQLLNAIHRRRKAEEPKPSTLDTGIQDQLNQTLYKFTEIFEQQRDRSQITTTDIKLPRINIKPFSGSYKEWPSFQNLFESSIDKNESLTNVQKFQYLSSFLQGEASTLIRHLPVVESSYNEAWEKLKLRYDRKNLIVTSLIQTFMDQPAATTKTPNQLRRLSDVSDEVIRGLKALGSEADGRDPWLIHILENKLDSETKQAWSLQTVHREYPTIRELLDFINERCNALNISSEPPTTSVRNNKPPVLKSFHDLVVATCPKCSSGHFLVRCEEFKKMNVTNRKKFVADHNLCYNCLSANHTVATCKSKYSCHTCKRRHHSLLHTNNTEKTENNDKIKNNNNDNNKSPNHNQTNFVSALAFSSQKPDSSTNNNEISLITQNHNPSSTIIGNASQTSTTKLSLLPTAQVMIKDSRGVYQSCRALLDSGSQASFITEACTQRLSLKRERTSIKITGLASTGISEKARGRVMCDVMSIYKPNTNITIEALILSKIRLRFPQSSLTQPSCHT